MSCLRCVVGAGRVPFSCAECAMHGGPLGGRPALQPVAGLRPPGQGLHLHLTQVPLARQGPSVPWTAPSSPSPRPGTRPVKPAQRPCGQSGRGTGCKGQAGSNAGACGELANGVRRAGQREVRHLGKNRQLAEEAGEGFWAGQSPCRRGRCREVRRSPWSSGSLAGFKPHLQITEFRSSSLHSLLPPLASLFL